MARTIIENIVIRHYTDEVYFEFCKYTSIRFFEILYFEKGSGTLKINGNTLKYEANSIFVLIPDDVYIACVETPTTVTTIKFLKSFFYSAASNNSTLPVNNWFRQIEGILQSESHNLRVLEFDDVTELNSFASLINMLVLENNKRKSFDIFIIENSLSIILHIIARVIRASSTASIAVSKPSSKIQDIVNYIQVNIYNPALLTNKELAEEFNIAENYLGQYFKNNMGISLKKYILKYKLKLVETRLLYTDMPVSEIAMELGFTDTSHLNKTFLAYKNISIKEFRHNSLLNNNLRL